MSTPEDALKVVEEADRLEQIALRRRARRRKRAMKAARQPYLDRRKREQEADERRWRALMGIDA